MPNTVEKILNTLGIEVDSKHLETEIISSINPATEDVLAKVRTCHEKEYELIIKEAQNAFSVWRLTPAPKRGEIIRQIGDCLREHKTALGQLIALEMGKTVQEAYGEVQEMIDMADFAVGQSRMLYGKTMHSERAQHRMYEQWHPYGIVGVITAFNFPGAVWAWNAFLAAIAGNITVWKPSLKTPLTAIAIHKLCQQVLKANHVPTLFYLMIPPDHSLTQRLLEDERVPLISFTGSCAVGAKVSETVAKRYGRCLLELGGNNALIIDESANLELAVPAIVFGAIGTSGQRCTTTRRLLIHQSCYATLLKRLISAYEQISIGHPLDENHHMGPLIDQAAVDTYQKTLQQITKQGGKIEIGGRCLEEKGYYVQPTLVSGLKNENALVQQETFAPILFVMPFQTLEEAIVMNNQVKQGLSSALFTNHLLHAEQFLAASGSDCGIANINIGTSGAEIGGAFGGEKHTGGGRESGSDAWKAYMRRQTNTINWGEQLPLAQGIQFNLN